MTSITIANWPDGWPQVNDSLGDFRSDEFKTLQVPAGYRLGLDGVFSNFTGVRVSAVPIVIVRRSPWRLTLAWLAHSTDRGREWLTGDASRRCIYRLLGQEGRHYLRTFELKNLQPLEELRRQDSQSAFREIIGPDEIWRLQEAA